MAMTLCQAYTSIILRKYDFHFVCFCTWEHQDVILKVDISANIQIAYQIKLQPAL